MNKRMNEGQAANGDALLLAKLLAPETPRLQRQHAFGRIVRRFQDMAYGYAYSLLGDRDLAEEAAQEAFLVAWQKLPQLQHPQAFLAWFKRIVFTQSYSLGRRRRVETVPLSDVAGAWERGQVAAVEAAFDPHIALECSERRSEVRRAVAELPEGERAVVVLFYINEYSRQEIAEFLGITPVAVKKRLATARRRLKERMVHMLQDDLHDQCPSRDSAFAVRVLAFTRQFGDLLRAGTPILKTLETCAAVQKDNPRLQQAIGEMRQQIQEGGPLRVVLAHYPDLFDPYYIAAAALGEEVGALDLVLGRLACGERFDTAEKLRALQEEMRTRLEAQGQLPRVMAAFPHLFRESDLRAVAIGEETGTVAYVVHRLTGGVEYNSEAGLQALRAEMDRLGERLRKA